MEDIRLAHGAGGEEMDALIASIRGILGDTAAWKHGDSDAATFDLGDGRHICFTTDSYTVEPLFFPGGDIGHLATSGTINDLCMMGAKPLGLSMGLIVEEGMPGKEISAIMETIARLSKKTGIPIATGDTKVLDKGKVDKVLINTAGVGIVKEGNILAKPIEEGDTIILSGGLGEHAVALLSRRFDFETPVISDSKPLIEEVKGIKYNIKVCKDPTRGGLASALNEIAHQGGHGIDIHEDWVPIRKEVRRTCDMLGLDPLQLACEGRLVCVCPDEKKDKVLQHLKQFNQDAAIIGAVKGKDVVLRTRIGARILPKPRGALVPRIC